jgi:hypothetical protein
LEKVAGCLTGCHACLLPLSKAWPPLFLLQVTYPLHIILRYEVERGLLDGSIKVDDVPQVWNAKMKQYLGVEPDSDAQGCLQVRSRCVCLSAETLNALHLLGAQHGQSSATTSACQLRVGGGGKLQLDKEDTAYLLQYLKLQPGLWSLVRIMCMWRPGLGLCLALWTLAQR